MDQDQVNLRCNPARGYCDLSLDVGRYEMTQKEIRLPLNPVG